MLIFNAEFVISHSLFSVHCGGRRLATEAACSHGRLSRGAWCDWLHGWVDYCSMVVAWADIDTVSGNGNGVVFKNL